jgi:uncharacterized protein
VKLARQAPDEHMGSARGVFSIYLLIVTVAAWSGGFTLVHQHGTWVPFTVIGPVMASVALFVDRDLRRLLRPSLRILTTGIGVGVLMVAATHFGYFVVKAIIPQVQPATRELYAFLNVGTFSPGARAVLIVAIAASEEVLFRGTIASHHTPLGRGQHEWPLRNDRVVRIVGLAVLYALATVTLWSPLLVACAFSCGFTWGIVRVICRSVLAPVVAHVIWDLSVLILWPVL